MSGRYTSKTYKQGQKGTETYGCDVRSHDFQPDGAKLWRLRRSVIKTAVGRVRSQHEGEAKRAFDRGRSQGAGGKHRAVLGSARPADTDACRDHGRLRRVRIGRIRRRPALRDPQQYGKRLAADRPQPPHHHAARAFGYDGSDTIAATTRCVMRVSTSSSSLTGA